MGGWLLGAETLDGVCGYVEGSVILGGVGGGWD